MVCPVIDLVILCVTKNALVKKTCPGSVKLLSAVYTVLPFVTSQQVWVFPARNTRLLKALVIGTGTRGE